MKIELSDQIKKSNIALKKTADLLPYIHNSRKHEEWQVTQIAASIKEFGFTNPVLIDEENEIIAGHGRVLAAQKLEIKEVPVIILAHLSDAQKKAYRIADNKIALNSSWLNDFLKLDLADLKDSGIELSAIGFNDLEFSNFFIDDLEITTEEEKENAWEGMPEFEDKEPCFRKIVVSFDDEEAVANFFKLINQKFTEKTKSIWHPYKENANLKDLSYQ